MGRDIFFISNTLIRKDDLKAWDIRHLGGACFYAPVLQKPKYAPDLVSVNHISWVDDNRPSHGIHHEPLPIIS